MVVGDHKPVLHNFIQTEQSSGSQVGLQLHIISPHPNAYPFATIRVHPDNAMQHERQAKCLLIGTELVLKISMF